MGAQKRLPLVPAAKVSPSASVLVQPDGSDDPMFTGDNDEAPVYVCGGCRKPLIVGLAKESAIEKILIRCGCGAYNAVDIAI